MCSTVVGLEEKYVATQLADETLFLVHPKKELESKFLVDPLASALRRKRTRKSFMFAIFKKKTKQPDVVSSFCHLYINVWLWPFFFLDDIFHHVYFQTLV